MKNNISFPDSNKKKQHNYVIVIIGCGPAGAGCAIKLKKETSSKGWSPRIIVCEGKTLEKKPPAQRLSGEL